MFTGEQHTSW